MPVLIRLKLPTSLSLFSANYVPRYNAKIIRCIQIENRKRLYTFSYKCKVCRQSCFTRMIYEPVMNKDE